MWKSGSKFNLLLYLILITFITKKDTSQKYINTKMKDMYYYIYLQMMIFLVCFAFSSSTNYASFC